MLAAVAAERLSADPLMMDASHQEGVVECDGANGKTVEILEVRRLNMRNGQRLHLPVQRLQF